MNFLVIIQYNTFKPAFLLNLNYFISGLGLSFMTIVYVYRNINYALGEYILSSHNKCVRVCLSMPVHSITMRSYLVVLAVVLLISVHNVHSSHVNARTAAAGTRRTSTLAHLVRGDSYESLHPRKRGKP